MVVSELSDQRTTLPPLPRSVAEGLMVVAPSISVGRWHVDDPPVEALMATAAGLWARAKVMNPGTDTVLDASRLDRTGGAPMRVRSMEGLGVVFTDAKHCHRAR